MKDYKLSEMKEICNANHRCTACPLYELCYKLANTLQFYDLEIDEVE